MNKQELDSRVMTRAVLIASSIMLLIFIGIHFAQELISNRFPRQAGNIQTGLMLFTIWLLVSSTLRSIHKMRRSIPAWKLIFAGTFITAIGMILYTGFLILYPKIAKSAAATELADATMNMIIFFTAIAFLISLISTINLKVKSEFWGNVLEAIIIVGGILLFLYLA